MKEKPNKTRPVGRPAAGAKAGERVKDYPQLSVRVPPHVRREVEALSEVRNVPQWHIITDAIRCYFRDLRPAEQRAVKRLASAARTQDGIV